MSIEHEPREPIHIPWQQDSEGYYIRFVNHDGKYDIRDTNSALYLHADDPRVDHLFVMLYEDEDSMHGFRIWRGMIDQVMGEGAFNEMVNQMRDHDFAIILADTPTAQDIEFFEDYTNEEYVAPNPIDRIVELAMRNFELEWAYYSQEPGWQL